ncbi:hypothetical protein K438DRAFT_1727646 [Mycena galopus ATCC 62051]|nr:hypothetical protein K438DRAFT_1727646 [Mycena galopus ATCC 62051]
MRFMHSSARFLVSVNPLEWRRQCNLSESRPVSRTASPLHNPPHHDATKPPELIPDEIHNFLAGATEMPVDFVDGCWKAFGSLIWAYNENGKTKGADAEAFKKYGLDHLLSSCMLFPPTYYCTTDGCVNSGLLCDKDTASNVVLYTLSDGACPTFAHHLSCSGCKARYYPNYVMRDGVRNYYNKIPDTIQVGEHQYIERAVLNLFINLMLISWTSATNGACVYNTGLLQKENFPDHSILLSPEGHAS